MLERYEACVRNRVPAFFQIAKKVGVEKPSDLEQAWSMHSPAIQEFIKLSREINSLEELNKLPSPNFSLLDLKAFIAEKLLEKCCFCERRCGVDRTKGEKGFCGVGVESRVFGAHAHFGEESILVPSATIFFSGCTMKCVYCFLPDTVIATEKGVISLKELFDAGADEKHLPGGVMQRNTDLRAITHSGGLRKIKRIFKRNYVGEIIRLIPHYFPEIRCTLNHEFFATEDPPSGKIDKIKACELTINHYLVVPKEIRMTNEPKIINAKEILEWVKQPSYKKHLTKLTQQKFFELASQINRNSFELAKEFNLSPTYIRLLRARLRQGYNHSKAHYKLFENNGRIRLSNEKGKGIPKIIEVTPSLAKLLGYYCAKGSVLKCRNRPNSWRVVFTYGAHEDEYINETKNLLKKVFDSIPRVVHCSPTTRVELSSPSVALFFKTLCGSSAKEKRVPQLFVNASKESVESFLDGYVAGDGWRGYCSKTPLISVNTVSKQLALDIFWLFLKVGKLPRFYVWKPRPQKKIGERVINQSTLYYAKVRKRNPSVIENDSSFFIPIRKISLEAYDGEVYNLEVENDHSYLANFVGVKNCQNAPDSVDASAGEVWSPERIARWIEFKRREGCKNVNWVGGDPTPNLHNILKALQLSETNIPVVWNSNSYYSTETSKLLWGIADVYLLDFRYANDACAQRLSSAPNYPEVARRNFLTAALQGEVLCRLLVLPNHVKCDAKPILAWLSRVLQKKVLVNVMPQYRPWFKAWEHEDVAHALSASEFLEARDYAKKLGLTLAD